MKIASVLATVTLFAISASAATAATPRTSLTDIENDVMCVECHEPLNVSQSPGAESERDFIRTRIARGETKQQIINDLVAQYGPSVLGKPPARGFNLTVYILPPAILAAGIVVLVITLPKWRRRAQAKRGEALGTPPAITPTDAHRLEQDLAHYKG